VREERDEVRDVPVDELDRRDDRELLDELDRRDDRELLDELDRLAERELRWDDADEDRLEDVRLDDVEEDWPERDDDVER
jgi:hypothetical protein